MNLKDKTPYERIRELERILLASPTGLTKSELARTLGVHRSTAGRMIEYYSTVLQIDELVTGKTIRYVINPDQNQVNVVLNQHERLALYLATRLLVQSVDRQNKHASNALRKIVDAVGNEQSPITKQMNWCANLIDGTHQQRDMRADGRFMSLLEAVTKAIETKRKIRVKYRSRGNGGDKIYLYEPYLIEPNPVGRTICLRGKRINQDGATEMQTLRLDRVREIELTTDSYEIPKTYNLQDDFRHAWGVWIGDKEPVTVELQFSADIKERVMETHWHATEQRKNGVNGSLLWSAEISEWKEMIPWILNWGKCVTVVNPPELRDMIKAEIQMMVSNYEL